MNRVRQEFLRELTKLAAVGNSLVQMLGSGLERIGLPGMGQGVRNLGSNLALRAYGAARPLAQAHAGARRGLEGLASRIGSVVGNPESVAASRLRQLTGAAPAPSTPRMLGVADAAISGGQLHGVQDQISNALTGGSGVDSAVLGDLVGVKGGRNAWRTRLKNVVHSPETALASKVLNPAWAPAQAAMDAAGMGAFAPGIPLALRPSQVGRWGTLRQPNWEGMGQSALSTLQGAARSVLGDAAPMMRSHPSAARIRQIRNRIDPSRIAGGALPENLPPRALNPLPVGASPSAAPMRSLNPLAPAPVSPLRAAVQRAQATYQPPTRLPFHPAFAV